MKKVIALSLLLLADLVVLSEDLLTVDAERIMDVEVSRVGQSFASAIGLILPSTVRSSSSTS